MKEEDRESPSAEVQRSLCRRNLKSEQKVPFKPIDILVSTSGHYTISGAVQLLYSSAISESQHYNISKSLIKK
jgi:hypothetical protein